MTNRKRAPSAAGECWYLVHYATYDDGSQRILDVRFLGCDGGGDPGSGSGDGSGNGTTDCGTVEQAIESNDTDAVLAFDGNPYDNFGGDAANMVFKFSKNVKDNPDKLADPALAKDVVNGRLYAHSSDWFGVNGNQLTDRQRLFFDLEIKYFAPAIGSVSPAYAGTRSFTDGSGREHDRELYIFKTQDVVGQASANGIAMAVDPNAKPYTLLFFDRNTNTFITAYPTDLNTAKSVLGTERSKGLTAGQIKQISSDPSTNALAPDAEDYNSEYDSMLAAEAGC